MSFFPEGLDREDDERPPAEVPLVKAESDGPWFTLLVNRISMEEFRSISSALQSQPRGMRPGSSAAKKAAQQWTERYLKRVLAGWRGCTLANWESICRDGKTFAGPRVQQMRKDKTEIDFSHEAAVYLHENTWPEHFSEPLLEALKAGVDEQTAEDDEKKAG